MRKALFALSILALAFSLPAQKAAGKPPLRVYVSVDMEGISGVVHGDQVTAGTADHAAARRWMAGDVNAVVRGLVEAGATEIVVNDSHGGMRNIPPEELLPPAALITGTPKPLSMMEGVGPGFAGCLFVGYHARAGTADAILDHTISGAAVFAIRVNGRELPELGLNAAVAGCHGVPVLMLSGDEAACRQAREILGGDVVTVAVKEAMGRNAARLLPMDEARRRLQEGARAALAGRAARKPFALQPPFRFELVLHNSGQAEAGTWLPGVRRVDGRTLAFETADYLEGAKILRALISLAAGR